MLDTLEKGVSSRVALPACQTSHSRLNFASTSRQSRCGNVMCGTLFDGRDIALCELEDVLAIFGPPHRGQVTRQPVSVGESLVVPLV